MNARASRFAYMLLLALPTVGHAQQVIENGSSVSAWTAAPASGVSLRLSADSGRAGEVLRVDFDFNNQGGWAAFRKETRLQLPDNYEFSFWLKADAPVNTLEFKLVDASGDNVWWVRRPEFEYRGDWRRITFRKRHVTFAWGPRGGGDITDVAALEFAITAGNGGRGVVWIDDLVLTPRPVVQPPSGPPVVSRSATAYSLDLREPREYGGVTVNWRGAGQDRDYDVQTSADGQSWQTVRAVRSGRRARDVLQLPETESRYLRVVVLANDSAAAIQNVEIAPLEFGAERNRLFEQLAGEAGGDLYPRYFAGEQTYWTVVGNARAEREAMINESAAIEVGKRAFTLEPFLHVDGKLIGWGAASQTSLQDGYLPIPSVEWQTPGVQLRTTTWTDNSGLWVRYLVSNRAAQQQDVTVYVALRPFQVNPPTQFLNTPGGATRIRHISFAGARVLADSIAIISLTPPSAFGAATFDQGDITQYLQRGTLPAAVSVTDSAELLASGALAYRLAIAARDSAVVELLVPFGTGEAGDATASLAATTERWKNELDRFIIDIPAAPDIGPTVRSTLAYILINQDDAAIQPGSRSYERSWIRDGSLTSAALLKLGHHEDVKRFIEWYAPYQYKDGKVPCCVDRQGAGAVPENDSHGQLIYLIAEYFRFTADTALVRRTWPHIEMAVAYMDSLRNSRRTPEFAGTGYWGMMPQSISHEGYSAKPMHSYWDNFFALKGFKDGAWLAQRLGRTAQARAWARMRDEFNDDLLRSFRWTMQKHNIDYLAGAVELGDFDATSTTVGLNPAGAQRDLPADALRRTFEKYWTDFLERRVNWQAAATRPDTSSRFQAYTPYEWRVVGALVRLGERERAHEVLNWFMDHRRPAAWNHWAEVVYRDERKPGFIGDMPHTWVGSDFIRSVVDMFVYEDDAGAQILAAGIPETWLPPGDTITISNIRTPYGVMSYRVHQQPGNGDVHFNFSAAPRPPAGFIIKSIADRPIRAARADGRTVPHTAESVRLRTLPRMLILSY